MNPLVLDASVALPWIFAGEVPPLARRARQLMTAGTRAVAPGLWQWEVANSIVMAEQRNVLGASFAESWESAEYWFALVSTDERPSSAVAAAQTLARRHGLSVYDAVYLETRQLGRALGRAGARCRQANFGRSPTSGRASRDRRPRRLALRLQAPLATLDQPLRRAARRAGVIVEF